MKEGYRLLGDFIQPVDERNRDLRVDYLLGVSISKQFIPSIANIVGTDLSNYKIIVLGNLHTWPCYCLGMAKRFQLPFYEIRTALFQVHIPCLRL